MQITTTAPIEDNGRIRVLYILDTFMEMAGSERNLYEIVTRLDPRRYEPLVMCLHGGNMVRQLREKGFLVIDLGIRRIYAPSALLKAHYVYRFIRRRNVKIVVTYHEGSDYLGGVVARLAGVPVVISSRRDMGYRLERRHLFIYRWVNLLYDRILTVSEGVKNITSALQKVPLQKMVTIYNGVPAEQFGPPPETAGLRKSLGIADGRPIIGSLAVVRPIKGHRYFIEAAAIAARSRPDAVFLVIGWEPHPDYAREMKELARERGLEGKLFFLGGRSDTAALLALMDVSVISSMNEGFSNTIVESMAAGKPVIATNGGGNPEAVVDGVTGLLVPPADAGALAAAMLRLLETPEEARLMGARGKERAQRLFGMQQMMDETDDLYRTLLAEKEGVGVRKPLLRMATRTVKQGISQASYYAGMLFPKRDEQRGDCVRILAYHRINDDQFSLPGMSIRVRNFEQQMKFLRLCFDPISLEEAVNHLSRRERLPGRAVVVTFDDGYRDNYLNAWPILKQLGIPATIFLSVEAIETGGMLWFDLITEGFRRTARREADLRCYGMRLYRWRSPRERLAAAQEIIETGKRFPRKGRDCFVRGVLDILGVPYEEAASRRLMMRWSDVVKMNEKGMSFGSHGMSHTILSGLGRGELEREIALSKEIIRQRTGIDVKLFAYPNGGREDFNEESIGLLRRYGYISACTLLGGSNYADAHQLCLKRVCVTEGMESSAFGRFSKPLFATMLRKSFGI